MYTEKKKRQRCRCGGEERRGRQCVGVQRLVVKKTMRMMRRGCHNSQQDFPASLFSRSPFPSLPHWVCPLLPTRSSLALSPCLCLRCSARVTPQHCSVISGPKAALSEPTYWACRARARNGPPPAAFLLNRVPSPSANHSPALCSR